MIAQTGRPTQDEIWVVHVATGQASHLRYHQMLILQASPTLAGTLKDASNLYGAVGVAVSGNYAYVPSSTADSLSVIDITTPATPTLVGTLKDASNLDGAAAVAVSGNYAYVASSIADSLSVIQFQAR